MSFQCPACSDPRGLEITSRLELPPDSRSDEITLQTVQCARCSFTGIAVYEESRRGALDDESFHHTGYYVDSGDLKALKSRIDRCPDPGNPRCSCPVHRQFGTRNASGHWDGLSSIPRQQSFELSISQNIRGSGARPASSDLGLVRKTAEEKIRALRRENASRISDPYWSSHTGYNYGRWADRGFSIALGLLETTPPAPSEDGPAYLLRVMELVRVRRDEYRADMDDEDGACSGALDASMWAILDALPMEP